MIGKVAGVIVCGVALMTTLHAQQVEIPRDKESKIAEQPRRLTNGQPKVETHPETVIDVQPVEGAPAKLTIEQMREAGALAAQRVKVEMHDIEPNGEEPAVVPAHAPSISKTSAASQPRKVQAVQPVEPAPVPPFQLSSQTAFTKLADGFDLPVGRPDASGYYKAQAFRSHGHLGEDWDGVGGGNTDLGDPIYTIGDGVVVFARDCHQGWGNVVIVRHAYREGGSIRNIDSLYGHLDKILVRRGQAVRRGQQIATMGTAHGLYDSHLHLEIRKNLAIGMSRDKFSKDLSNYYDPSQFILSHRHLQSSGASCRVAMNTFIYDAKIRWDKLHNYSHAHTGGGSSDSAYALKKALVSQSSAAR